MVWRGDRADTSGEADLLTGALFHAYRFVRQGKGRKGTYGLARFLFSPPPGFCFDSLCRDVIMDDVNLEDYNFDEKVCS